VITRPENNSQFCYIHDPDHTMIELLPSARVEVVTGAPHSMYWETPQLFNDVMASFLRDVAAGRTASPLNEDAFGAASATPKASSVKSQLPFR
jgi:hypothetical protein